MRKRQHLGWKKWNIVLNKCPWGINIRWVIACEHDESSFSPQKSLFPTISYMFTGITWIRSFRWTNISYVYLSSLCHAYQKKKETSWVSSVIASDEETRNGPDSNLHIAGPFLTELQTQSLVCILESERSECSKPLTLQKTLESPNFYSGVLSKFAFIPLPPPKFLCVFGKKCITMPLR